MLSAWLKNKKGATSLEFILAILIIIVVLFLFITINISFKTQLSDQINFKKSNFEVCEIKRNTLLKNNGEIINDSCKRKESTDNDS